jgi:photosystem II stability/assembly factor-like uncharacterized protein
MSPGFSGSMNFPLVAGAIKTRSNIFKSTDATATWSNDNYGLNGGINCLAISPSSTATLYAGTNTGVYKSTDAGSTWALSNSGIGLFQIIQIVLDRFHLQMCMPP